MVRQPGGTSCGMIDAAGRADVVATAVRAGMTSALMAGCAWKLSGSSRTGGRSSRACATSRGTIEPMTCVFQRPLRLRGASAVSEPAAASATSAASGAGGGRVSKRAAHVSASGSRAGGRLTITGLSALVTIGSGGRRELLGVCCAGGCADCSGDKRSTEVRVVPIFGPMGGGCEDETE